DHLRRHGREVSVGGLPDPAAGRIRLDLDPAHRRHRCRQRLGKYRGGKPGDEPRPPGRLAAHECLNLDSQGLQVLIRILDEDLECLPSRSASCAFRRRVNRLYHHVLRTAAKCPYYVPPEVLNRLFDPRLKLCRRVFEPPSHMGDTSVRLSGNEPPTANEFYKASTRDCKRILGLRHYCASSILLRSTLNPSGFTPRRIRK